MAEACNALPMKKKICLGILANHLQVSVLFSLCWSKLSHPHPQTIYVPSSEIAQSGALSATSTLVAGTPVCSVPLGALTGTTLVNGPSHPSTPNIPFQHIAAPKPPVGRALRVEDFFVIKFLSAGGFGLVFLVFDKISRRYFALKVVQKNRIHFSSFPKIFEEQRVGRVLSDSKWVAGVEGSFDDSVNFYVLMVRRVTFFSQLSLSGF